MSKESICVVARRLQKEIDKRKAKKGGELKLSDYQEVLAIVAGMPDYARYLKVLEKIAPTGLAVKDEGPVTIYVVYGGRNIRALDEIAMASLEDEANVMEALANTKKLTFGTSAEANAYRNGVLDAMGSEEVSEVEADVMRYKVLEGWGEKYSFLFDKVALLWASNGFCELRLTKRLVWQMLISSVTESEVDSIDVIAWHLKAQLTVLVNSSLWASGGGKISISCESVSDGSVMSEVQSFTLDQLRVSEDGKYIVLGDGVVGAEIKPVSSGDCLNRCRHCGADLTSPRSVVREYVNLDGDYDGLESEDAQPDDSPSIFAEGHYDGEGNFDPDHTVCLDGRYDLCDDSDKCANCGK